VTLVEIRAKLAGLDYSRLCLLREVTLMNPDERLVCGCRDYEKWAKAYLTDWKREREKALSDWEDGNP